MKRLTMNLYRVFLFCFAFIFVTGCSSYFEKDSTKHIDEDQIENTATDTNSSPLYEEGEVSSEFVFENDYGQKFTIFRGYVFVEEFIKKANEGDYSEKELQTLYDDIVLKPFHELCVMDGSIERIKAFYQSPHELLLVLENLLDQINERNIVGVIKEALLESSYLLPSDHDNTIVCLMPTVDRDISEGVSYGYGTMVYFYKPNSHNIDSFIQSLIAHEYSHSVDPNQEPNNILDLIIGEGKATYFQRQVYPEVIYHDIYEDNLELSAFVKENLDSRDYDTFNKINGWDGTFPPNYGYVEGYKIIQALAEEEPELTLKEIIDLDGKSILKRSKYYEKLGLEK